MFTKTNPVKENIIGIPSLDLENFGLSVGDLNTVFDVARSIHLQPCTLKKIVEHLQNVYCQHIGVEYVHIDNVEEKKWIEDRLHRNENRTEFSVEEKKNILNKLNQAVSFETFLHTKYVGQKRFSIEGGESFISGLDELIEMATEKGVRQVVLGMAHRGRLNTLANIFHKSTQDIFSEFDGKDYDDPFPDFDGDVKYHMGMTLNRKTKSGKEINLNLVPNPSHLETVGALVEGITRAKQDRYFPDDFSKIIPLIVHGDAAVSGQGIVYEIAQMAQLDGYKTGGTIHIVINNQVGFTTNAADARSSRYCTDIAKVTGSPVFHVNADDVEAVVHVMLLALDYRIQFGKDIFIDLLGYRKYGHNEGDEPRFTQPILYKAIGKHENSKDIYADKLIKAGIVDAHYVRQIELDYKAILDKNLEASRKIPLTKIKPFMSDEWDGFFQASVLDMLKKVDTSFSKIKLTEIAEVITNLPNCIL